MFEDEEDFDIEDVDFPCYENQENRDSTIKPPSVSHHQGTILPKCGVDFFNGLVENAPSKETAGIVKALKRKFPGPAGLLPERHNISSTSYSDCETSFDQSVNNSKDKHDIEQASSQFGCIFEMSAWKLAQTDIGYCGFQGTQSCNIAHLKRCAFSNKSKALKYPFLAVAVTNMDTGQDLFVTLKDYTGEIQGHIDSEVLEQFPVELRRGCVLILKNVGALKSRQIRGLYLLITPNTLSVIYPSDSGISKLDMLKESCEDIDFSNVDTCFNTSLDLSWNETPPRQSRVATPNINRNCHATPSNLMKQNQFLASRSSTPKVDNNRQSNHSSTNQTHQNPNYFQSSNNNTGAAKPFSSQISSNVPFQFNQSLENSSFANVRTTERDVDRSFTVLSQNGINRGEDLTSTVNSLFEGIDTDSIFDDF